MPTVQEILCVKGNQVLTIDPEATVLDAALLMNERRVGSVVVSCDGQVRGIFTERDVLTRVVVPRRDPSATPVAEVMTEEVVCGKRHTTIDEARGVMKNRRLRHLPILEGDGRLCGMISIGDLNAYDNNSKELTIHLLESYIYGPT